MTIRPGSEFNLTSAPSEALRRKLLYLATTGSGSLASGFKKASDTDPDGQEDPGGQFVAMMMQMATADEMRRFRERLELVDEASTAALLENDEKLREAEEELERIRARALEVTLPNGRKVRVYRDGDIVRDEGGNLIDFMKPADLPAGAPDLSEFKAAASLNARLRAERKQILAYRDRLDATQDRLDQGPVSLNDFDTLKDGLGDIPDSVKAQVDRIAAERGIAPPDEKVSAVSSATLDAPTRPAKHFASAAPAITADDFADLPGAEPPDGDGPANPRRTASTPAPG